MFYSLILLSFQTLNYITNSGKVVKIFVIDNNVKSFFAKIDEIGKFKRVYAKIT